MPNSKKGFYDLYKMWLDAFEKRKAAFIEKPTWPLLFDYQLTLSNFIGMISHYLNDLKENDYFIYVSKLYELIKERVALIEDYKKAFSDKRLFDLYCQDAVVNVEKFFLYSNLLELENKFNVPINELYSFKIFDFLMECKKRFNKMNPYILSGVNTIDDYLGFAADVKLHYRDHPSDELFKFIDKQFDSAIAALKQNTNYLSLFLGLEHIDALKRIYLQKKDLYQQYKKSTSFIDQEILSINNHIHYFAQEEIRNSYEMEVENLFKNGKDAEAIKLLKAIILIDEERFLISGGLPEYKLMLVSHLEKITNTFGLSDEDEKRYNRRLDELKKSLTHDDEYVMDGDNEYKRNPK